LIGVTALEAPAPEPDTSKPDAIEPAKPTEPDAKKPAATKPDAAKPGCACAATQTAPGAAWTLLGLLGLGLIRRRRDC